MNIIVEGIDGTGKSTLIETLNKKLENKGIDVRNIKEIEKSPLSNVLKKMLKEDCFFRCNENFRTSIFETFILAAEFFYKQEYFRKEEKTINIYDRDFLTILSYQQLLIEKEYGDRHNNFFENFTKCLLFDIKDIDLLVYIKIPFEVSFKRIEERDNILLSDKDKEILKNVKRNFEENYLPMVKNLGINIRYLDTTKNLDSCIDILLKEIKYAQIKHSN